MESGGLETAVGVGGHSSCWGEDDVSSSSLEHRPTCVLDCLASCPWQRRLVSETQNKTCWSSAAGFLTALKSCCVTNNVINNSTCISEPSVELHQPAEPRRTVGRGSLRDTSVSTH